jgi:hypothetical protein
VERGEVQPPAGQASINGRPMGLRYAWPDPAKLLSAAP